MFWAELQGKVRDLHDGEVAPQLVSGHAHLGGRPLDALLAQLRAALPFARPDGGWMKSLSTPALTALLVLAAACSGGDSTDPSNVDPDATCENSAIYGVQQEPGVYCALTDLIASADVDGATQSFLYSCLSSLTAGRRQMLLDEFSALSDEDLAAALMDLAASDECDDYETAH